MAGSKLKTEEKIKAMMDFFGLSREEAIAELADCGEVKLKEVNT